MQQQDKNNFSSAINVLAFSIGLIYFSFGVLKFFHNISPAEAVAIQTTHKLTLGLFADNFLLFTLAVWECLIGIALILRKWMKPVLVLMFIHLFFTFTPFIFFPAETFAQNNHGFTLLGQYIMKNIVIITSGFVMWQYFVVQAKASSIGNKYQLKKMRSDEKAFAA